MPTWQLSAIADEIDPNLERQVAALRKLKIPRFDLRSIGGVNVLSLSDQDIVEAKEVLEDANIRPYCVDSPVNKVPLDETHLEAETAKLERAIQAAKLLGVRRVRVFSPEPPTTDLDTHWAAIKQWIRKQVDIAERAEVVLLHENDAKFFGAYPKGSQLLLGEFGGPNFRAVFDFANSVLLGYQSRKDWFPWILPYLEALHIKDAVSATGQVVPAGEGQGEIAETLKLLVDEGWDGVLVMEPHLSAAGPLGGFSGEQLFETAVTALRQITKKQGIKV